MIVTAIFGSLFVYGCGGSDDDGDTPTDTTTTDLEKQGKVMYQGKDFTIVIPQKWDVISPEEFTSNYPKEVVISFRNNIKNEIFTANITIAVTALENEISSEDFGKNSVKKQKEFIPEFKETKTSKQDLTFKEEKILTYFIQSEGKKSAQDPLLKFAQLFAVYNKKAYTISASYLPTEDENVVNAINEMINSFSLK